LQTLKVTGEFVFKLLNPAISLVLSATVLLLWRSHRTYRYLPLLALAFSFCGIAFAANDFLQGFDGPALRLLVNALFFGAVLSACLGASVRVRAPIAVAWFTALCLCGALSFCWFLFVQPSTPARIYVVNATFAAMALTTVITLIRAGPRSWVDWLFVGVAILLVLLSISRPIAMLVDGLDINVRGSLNDSDYWATVQALTPVVAVVILLAFLAAFGLQLFNELRDDAERDHLTGLLNRRGFEFRATAFLRSPTAAQYQAAVMLVDIDNFKAVNDTFGHAAGDRAIAAVAQVLAKQGADVVARVGGEEFALFYKDAHRGKLRWHASAIRAALERAEIEGLPEGRPLTVSIGIHLRHPFESLAEAMRQADGALYSAKRSGKNQATFAEPFLRSA
jgi:diguanylate cyclase (GGDEF)-like protein